MSNQWKQREESKGMQLQPIKIKELEQESIRLLIFHGILERNPVRLQIMNQSWKKMKKRKEH